MSSAPKNVGKKGKKVQEGVWLEFECPNCRANNPFGDGFRVGDTVYCGYCSCAWDVKKRDDDKYRLDEH